MAILPSDFSDLDIHCTDDVRTCTALVTHPADVLGDRDRWPSHICWDVACVASAFWAKDRAHAIAGTNRLGWMGGFADQQWARAAEHSPFPIGRDTILNGPHNIHGTRDVLEDAARFAIFEDDATLYFPLVAHVSGTMVEMFFLARPSKIVDLRPNWRVGLEWQPASVRFRIAHEYDKAPDPSTSTLIRDASEWWMQFSDRVFIRPKRGFPAAVIDWDAVLKIGREMVEEYRDSGRATGVPERPVTDKDVHERASFELDLDIKLGTFRKRIAEARRTGRMPPGWRS